MKVIINPKMPCECCGDKPAKEKVFFTAKNYEYLCKKCFDMLYKAI